jgi:hypothetical protein
MEEGFEVESRLEEQEDARSDRRLTTGIAITAALLAVGAAFSSQFAGHAAHHSLAELNQAAIDQNLASDQWNFYQAKGIKRHVFEVQRDALRLQPGAGAAKTVATYDKEIKRYTADQDQIMKDARARERERDEAKAASQVFDDRYQRLSLAVAAFQIAIIVCSVAAIVKRPMLWYLGIAGGVVGLFYLVRELLPVAGGRAG